MRIDWCQIAVANESRYESPRGEVEGIHTLSTLRTKGLKHRRSTQSICPGGEPVLLIVPWNTSLWTSLTVPGSKVQGLGLGNDSATA